MTDNIELADENNTQNKEPELQTETTPDTCLLYRTPNIKSILFWISIILSTLLLIILVRFSLHYWATFAILLILILIPCFISCFFKCKKQSTIKYFLIILTIISLIGYLLGVIWRASDQCVFKKPTFDVWTNFNKNSKNDILKSMLRSSILASNPHNSQPWKFNYDMINNNIKIYFDYNRNIKGVDLLYREMHIGIGCGLENAYITGINYGYNISVDYFDNIVGNGVQLAAVVNIEDDNNITDNVYNTSLVYNNMISELYKSIPLRHTDRTGYDNNKIIPVNNVNTMFGLNDWNQYIKLFIINTTNLKSKFIDLQIKGTKALVGSEEQSKGGYEWIRKTCNEYKTKSSGLWLDAVGLDDSFLNVAKTFPPVGRKSEDQVFVNIVSTRQSTGSLFGIIAVNNYTNIMERIFVGQYWQRLHLYGTSIGFSMQPLNQVFESVDYARQHGGNDDVVNGLNTLMNDLGANNMVPIFGFRAGYSQNVNKFASARIDYTNMLV